MLENILMQILILLTLGDGMRDCLNNEVNLRFYIDYYAKNNLSANNSIKQLEEDCILRS